MLDLVSDSSARPRWDAHVRTAGRGGRARSGCHQRTPVGRRYASDLQPGAEGEGGGAGRGRGLGHSPRGPKGLRVLPAVASPRSLQGDTPRTTYENGNAPGAGAPGSASPSGARGRAPGSAPPSAFRSADHGSRPVISSHEPLPSTCLTPRTRLGLRNPSRERWGTGGKVQTRNPLHPNTFPASVLKLRGRGSEHILKNGWNVISEACGNSPSPDPCYGLGPWAGRHTWAEPHTCACRNCILGLVSASGQPYSFFDLRQQKPSV